MLRPMWSGFTLSKQKRFNWIAAFLLFDLVLNPTLQPNRQLNVNKENTSYLLRIDLLENNLCLLFLIFRKKSGICEGIGRCKYHVILECALANNGSIDSMERHQATEYFSLVLLHFTDSVFGRYRKLLIYRNKMVILLSKSWAKTPLFVTLQSPRTCSKSETWKR